MENNRMINPIKQASFSVNGEIIGLIVQSVDESDDDFNKEIEDTKKYLLESRQLNISDLMVITETFRKNIN